MDNKRDLHKEFEARKLWFFECQLRHLNIESFFTFPDKEEKCAADSKPYSTFFEGVEGPKPPLDCKQSKEREKHKHLLGRMADWLQFKVPHKLIEKLEAFKNNILDSENLKFKIFEDNSHKRKSFDAEQISQAISRIEIAKRDPFLIPSLFGNFDLEKPEYQAWVRGVFDFIGNDDEGERNKYISLLDNFDKNSKLSIQITPVLPCFENNDHLQDFPLFPKEKTFNFTYKTCCWIKTASPYDIYLNNENADFGLNERLRLLYLYGTLPKNFPVEKVIWRNRKYEWANFDERLERLRQNALSRAMDEDERELINFEINASAKFLKEALLKSETDILSKDFAFSSTAEEILKRAMLHFKYWLDEPFKLADEEGYAYQNLVSDNKKYLGKDEKSEGQEMQYWSENHYILFATGEYLAGQLWENQEFYPGKDYSAPESGKIMGTLRKERGRSRVLKWLNYRLMFGWTEFNSVNYYKEHFEPLANLVDFSLDAEVKTKATAVLDLLLFDIVRFLHKGTLGACGGRSQFQSKVSGWDHAISDLIELAFGSKGAFTFLSSFEGAALATSTYKIPEVLFEIAINPPVDPFVDRSRVSISFDEAAKLGIQYSKTTKQQKIYKEKYKEKRVKYYSHLDKINKEIEDTHFIIRADSNGNRYKETTYGPLEDDTVLWWTMSVYFNKEVLDNTNDCVKKWRLDKTGVFENIPKFINFGIPFIKTAAYGFTALSFGLRPASLLIPVLGNPFDNDLVSDDFSVLLEGSSRTRANIYTYRSRDGMLSSVQNFRPGQLNYQSDVNRATLNSLISIFTTAPTSRLSSLSPQLGLLGGGVMGAWLSPLLIPIGSGLAPVALAGLAATEATQIANLENFLYEKDDGPSHWTGYWALPMVVQHENVSIIAYDFPWIQKQLAECASHLWIPQKGFANGVEEYRANYEDDNFVLWDIFDIGKKGFWLFGKIIHVVGLVSGRQQEEGYVGIFSNKKPDWLDKDSDIYRDNFNKIKSDEIEKEKEKSNNKQKIENLEAEKDAKPHKYLREEDYFENKDWYVEGKNIWIIHIGSNAEYQSFENFKEKVSKAKVTIDDVGELACSYDIPKPDGSIEKLSLNYSNGGNFQLNDQPINVNLYPRYENPFIRGGHVEWGQREYIIEHNGKNLLHSFNDFSKLERRENVVTQRDSKNIIRAFVIYIKSEHSFQSELESISESITMQSLLLNTGMELGSICEASIVNLTNSGVIAEKQIVAIGETYSGLSHEAEFIFLDTPNISNENDLFTLSLNYSGDIWSMSFDLKVLVGDFTFKNCKMYPFQCRFKEGRSEYKFLFKPSDESQILRPFYVIAHKANTIEEVEEALRNGANAIGPDLNVREGTEELCIYHPSHWETIGDEISGSFTGGGSDALSLDEYLDNLHNLAIKYPNLSLVIFDCKPLVAKNPEYGRLLLNQIREKLTHDNEINIIISVAEKEHVAVFDKISNVLSPREGLMIDEENDPADISNYFNEINVKNFGYGNGITLLNRFLGPNVKPSLETACAIRAASNFPKVIFGWTVNEDDKMRDFIQLGVDGLITDDIEGLIKVVNENQNTIRMATREDNPFNWLGLD